MLAGVMYSNNLTDTVSVAADLMRRPMQIATSGVLGGVQNFDTGAITYDGAGNIKAMGTHSLLYDKVSRLVSGTVRVPSWVAGSNQTQTYSFDPFGNLTATGGVGARNTPTSAATNRLNGLNVDYDEAGNLINSGGATPTSGTVYEFDRLNRLQKMTTAAGLAREIWVYVYTADDERFWSFKLNGSGSLWSLRDLSGNVVRQFVAHLGWSTTKDSIYRGGQLLATVLPDSSVRHYHLDHLGTPRLITGPNAAMLAHHTYFPFGEEVTGSTADAERMKFTGHERDLNNAGGAEDDLDYMHARFCSPITGRFLSVDPKLNLRALAVQPQRWNRFSYAAGNPLKYIDPDGRDIYVPDWLASVVDAGLAQSPRFASVFTRVDIGRRAQVTFKEAAKALPGSTISSEMKVYRDPSGKIVLVRMVVTVPLGSRSAHKLGHEWYHMIEVLNTGRDLRQRLEDDHEAGIRKNGTGYESDAALEVESTIKIEMSLAPLSATGHRESLAAGFGVAIYVDGIFMPDMGPRY